MWRALIIRAALGGAAICAAGGMAGVGLANYVASGSFDFYKSPPGAEWQPEPSRMDVAAERFLAEYSGTSPGVGAGAGAGTGEAVFEPAVFER